jgi:hypothetical protein
MQQKNRMQIMFVSWVAGNFGWVIVLYAYIYLHPMSPSLLRAEEVSEDLEQQLVTMIFFHDEGWGSDSLTPCE